MAFTAAQLSALEAAAASGQLRVQLGDKVIQYQNLPDLLAAIRMARTDQSVSAAPANSGAFRHRTACFDD
jgi:hypothetical protein